MTTKPDRHALLSSLGSRPWWEVANAQTHEQARAFCDKLGTRQCAPVCLQHLSFYPAHGCPEVNRVWMKRYECWSLEEADKLNQDEVQLGYRDARAGEPKPEWPGNRTNAYVHGWHAGARDAGRMKPGEAPWLRELARQYIAKQKTQGA